MATRNQAYAGYPYPEYSFALDSSQTDSPTTVDIKYMLYTLYRRKYLILGIFAIVTSLVALLVNHVTPVYTANVPIIIEAQKNNVIDIQSVISRHTLDPATILNEVEVLQSRGLAEQIVDQFNLVDDPYFNPMAAGSPQPLPQEEEGFLPDEVSRVMRGFKKMVGGGDPVPEGFDKSRFEFHLARVRTVDNFLRNLEVYPIPRSRVINIDFTSSDPEQAAAITNAIAEQYLENQLMEKLDKTQRAEEWLNDRLVELRMNLRTSEKAVEDYRRSKLFIMGQGNEVMSQQLSELNSQLVIAKAKRAEIRARLSEVYELMESEEGLQAVPEVLNSGLIQRLKLEESQLQRKKSELENRYGDLHPRMINLKSELRDLREKIRNEVLNIIQALETESRVAQIREETLLQTISELETRQVSESASDIHLRELEREAETNRALFETFLERYKATSQQEKLQKADARIISYADIPTEPSAPNKKLFIALAAFGSIIGGILLAFLLNMLDNRFKSVKHVIMETDLPVLGLIPRVSRLTQGGSADYVLKRPFSSVAEAVRMIRTSINLLRVGKTNKVINVTSSVGGEGKSTFAVWLARMSAKAGQRVILVDCDIRNPNVHKIFTNLKGLTLSDFLAGKRKLANGNSENGESIAVDPQTGLHVIFANKTHETTLDLMNSSRMQLLINALKESYDLIILDSPPSLGVTDARILARMADTTVYLVKYDEMPREGVLAGIRNYRDFGLELSGIILSHVRAGSSAKYDYIDSMYYQN